MKINEIKLKETTAGATSSGSIAVSIGSVGSGMIARDDSKKKNKKKKNPHGIEMPKDALFAGNVAEGTKPKYKNKQVKGKDSMPKLTKPTAGHESPHPFRGKLVGEGSIPDDKAAGIKWADDPDWKKLHDMDLDMVQDFISHKKETNEAPSEPLTPAGLSKIFTKTSDTSDASKAQAGRPRGGPHIENVRFWDLPKSHLDYIRKDAYDAMKANPEGKKAGKYADELNDAETVLYWRKMHGSDEAKPEYEVKYAKSKKGPIKVTKFMTFDQAKKFLADVEKDGMKGIISRPQSAIHVFDSLDEISRNTLGSYISKASDARGHRKLSTKKVDNRYAGVSKASKKLSKKEKEDELDEVTPSVVKKAGRRSAGSYGRPGSKKQKRAASKSSRQWNPNDLDHGDDDGRSELGPEGPYAIVWHGQYLEWYGDGSPRIGAGRYKSKGDAGNVLAKNILTYDMAQKLLSTTNKMSGVGDDGDYGEDYSLVTNSSEPEIVPMSDLGKHFYGYDSESQEYGAKPEQDDHHKVMDLADVEETWHKKSKKVKEGELHNPTSTNKLPRGWPFAVYYKKIESDHKYAGYFVSYEDKIYRFSIKNDAVHIVSDNTEEEVRKVMTHLKSQGWEDVTKSRQGETAAGKGFDRSGLYKKMKQEFADQGKIRKDSFEGAVEERKLSEPEKKNKEHNVKKLKKHKKSFSKYGKDADSVMYAVATRDAKKGKKYK